MIGQRRRRKQTDFDKMLIAGSYLNKLKADRAEAEAEYRHAERLMWAHIGKEDEWLFYEGAKIRVLEIMDELECLDIEIEAATEEFYSALFGHWQFDDGA
mgnify:CR=1 FL=1